MQDIETPVSESDPQTLPVPIEQKSIKTDSGADDLLLGGQKCMRENPSAQLRWGDDGGAFLADGHGRGRIRHTQGGLPIGPRGQRGGEYRGNGITCAGDVPDFDRMGRDMNDLTVAWHQRHALLAL